MANRDPQFDAYVLKIHAVLDRLDYYRLLGVKHEATKSEVKKSFLKITSKFHPDRHRNAPENIKTALYDIYKRLNEGYQVLSDPDKRKLYNEQMADGQVRFSSEIRMSMVPKAPEDTIVSRDAKQFYIKAMQELKSGNLLQADLNAKMAKSREPSNKAILNLIAQVQQAKKKK